MKCHCGKDLSDLNKGNIKRHKEKCGKKPSIVIHNFFQKKPHFEESHESTDLENNSIEVTHNEEAVCTENYSTADL